MGNSLCSSGQQNNTVSLKEKKLNSTELELNQIIKSSGEQNITFQDGSFEQCSLSLKYNIKFLNSTVKASQSIMADTDSSNNASNTKKYNIKTLKKRLEVKSKAQTRKSLIDWKKSTKAQSNNGERRTRASKLEAIKSLQSFLNKTPTTFQSIKISGDTFYKIRHEAIQPYYQMHQKIGEGAFGNVYKGKCLKTQQLRAIKILKKKIMNQNDQRSLLSQINILKTMDHINIIKLYDVFYNKNFFYVVTQFCSTGNLAQLIKQSKIKSERDCAFLMKQVISAVYYMHRMKIAHRDLKMQNIVLLCQKSKQKTKTSIKIIDFGLAKKTQYQFNNTTNIVGTLDYMAPQIFSGSYSCRSDIWSCGIILCILLIGYNPFHKNTKSQTIKAIKQQELCFAKPEWKKINQKAKDLISKMLEKKAEKRIQADKILSHDWFKQLGGEIQRSNSTIVVQNFRNYNRGNNFVCYIKNFLISRQLTQSVRQEMALIFQKIDIDSSGVIQKSELRQLYSLVVGVSDQQVEQIIQRIDQNRSGKIDFQEFLLCMTDYEAIKSHNFIQQAFRYFDQDNTGFIQRQQILNCLVGCDQRQIVNIIQQIDFNGDGKISKPQFFKYMVNLSL